jgi:hypothetical protein
MAIQMKGQRIRLFPSLACAKIQLDMMTDKIDYGHYCKSTSSKQHPLSYRKAHGSTTAEQWKQD